MHSFKDKIGKQWTACCECNRGGNGNDKDKCSCGHKSTEWNQTGCYLGEFIKGPIKKRKKKTKSKQRYQRYLEYGDMFEDFLSYCYWDAERERSWNGGSEIG